MYSQHKVVGVKPRRLQKNYKLLATLEVKQILHKLKAVQRADKEKKSFEKQNKTCVIALSETFRFLQYIQTL